MLGSECTRILSEGHEVIAPTSSEMDIISWDGVINSLQEVSPDVVLNCAGFTSVDACETEDFIVRKNNVEGPRNLAQCCARFECKFIHISSGYIFDGQKTIPQPYFEDDSPNPLSAYGRSKVESETAVRENSPNYIIIRSAWLYGINGRNFIKSIIDQAVNNKSKTLKMADDQYGSPTWAYRLALQISEIMHAEGVGTYHATAEGYCSPFEYAEHVLKKLGLNIPITRCSMHDLGCPARRPANCLLENRLLKKKGLHIMVDWKEDVNVFLDQYGEIMIKEAETKKHGLNMV